MNDAKAEPQYLSMPDPCPHITRLDVIGARLRGDALQLDFIEEHLENCEDRS